MFDFLLLSSCAHTRTRKLICCNMMCALRLPLRSACRAEVSPLCATQYIFNLSALEAGVKPRYGSSGESSCESLVKIFPLANPLAKFSLNFHLNFHTNFRTDFFFIFGHRACVSGRYIAESHCFLATHTLPVNLGRHHS